MMRPDQMPVGRAGAQSSQVNRVVAGDEQQSSRSQLVPSGRERRHRDGCRRAA